MTTADKIKDLDISSIIESETGLRLRKSGRSSFLEKCPFCGSGTGKGKTSAFSINKNLFKCFSCNRTGSAIDFVMFQQNIDVEKAIKYIAGKYNITTDDSKPINVADFKKEEKVSNEYVFKEKKDFTAFELKILGRNVTAEVCKKFNCVALEYYITKGNEAENKPSYRISSNENYPIYLFSYSYIDKDNKKQIFHKLYQPFSPDYRFQYIGTKPENYIFADDNTAKLLEVVRRNKDLERDSKLETLILTTGASDAMNVFAEGHDKNTGKYKYSVIWLNSETIWDKISNYDYFLLTEMCKEDSFYMLPDLDETGLRMAYKLALMYLDIKIILLPSDLKTFKSKGKPCKDVKDFFNIYKTNKYNDLSYYFGELLKIAMPLRFWDKITKYDKEGDVKSVELYLSNERIYQFLQANGFARLCLKTNKKEWAFVHIQNNIVTEIKEDSIQEYVNAFIINYLKDNLQYYDSKLIDKIHKSNEFKTNSLSKLKLIKKLDFKVSSEEYDHFLFKNCAWRITKDGIEQIGNDRFGDKYFWDYKIVDFNANAAKQPLFEIDYTNEYKKLLDNLKAAPHDEAVLLQKQIDKYPEIDKFTLQINNNEFSYIKYLYNTGRVFWEEEQERELTEEEQKIHDLFFISKVIAMGYMLYRYKQKSEAYTVYATDTESSIVGKHEGGTGKSIYMESVSFNGVRKMEYVDGQQNDLNNERFAFGNVTTDTDFVFLEDVGKDVDLHKYLNVIQGNMKVEPKTIQPYNIPFSESPKIIMNSNHAVRSLDGSLRRRLWFVGFCNYYHSENNLKGIKKHSPRSEFKKDLLIDYDENEQNLMFNFLAYCLSNYLKFRERIESPVDFIEKRNVQRELGDQFLDWADDYFCDERLDVELKRHEVFEDFCKTLSEKEQKFIKDNGNFKTKIEQYAHYKGWTLNPVDLITSDSERKKGRIRRTEDGKKVEFFFIRTIPLEVPTISNNTTGEAMKDMPV